MVLGTVVSMTGSSLSTWLISWWTSTPPEEVWDDMKLLYLLTSVGMLYILAVMVEHHKARAAWSSRGW